MGKKRLPAQAAMDEGRLPAANPEDATAPGGQAPSAAVDRATAVAVGDPTKATTTSQGSDIETVTQPEYVDRHFMEAYTRYVSLLANGVSHFRALDAVKVADPNFDLDEAAAISILQALNKTKEPVKLSESLMHFAATTPPGHVTNVYDALEFTDEMATELADDLYLLHQAAWIVAVNENLSRLGKPIITRINDQDVLDELRAEADTAARQIQQTFNRDLATALYGTYIEHHAVLGRQSSETILREAIEEWMNGRAGWKADQIATNQTNNIFNLAQRRFRERNGKLGAETGRIVPLGGQCDACQDASMLGTQPAEIILDVGMPLHVGCVHSVEWDYSPVDDWDGNAWTGYDASAETELDMTEELVLAFGKKGNPKALKEYFKNGAGGRINWGGPGDLTKCYQIAEKYLGKGAWGFCNERHKEATGTFNSPKT